MIEIRIVRTWMVNMQPWPWLHRGLLIIHWWFCSMCKNLKGRQARLCTSLCNLMSLGLIGASYAFNLKHEIFNLCKIEVRCHQSRQQTNVSCHLRSDAWVSWRKVCSLVSLIWNTENEQQMSRNRTRFFSINSISCCNVESLLSNLLQNQIPGGYQHFFNNSLTGWYFSFHHSSKCLYYDSICLNILTFMPVVCNVLEGLGNLSLRTLPSLSPPIQEENWISGI